MRREKLKHLTFAAIPLVLFLVVLEIGFRIYYDDHDGIIRQGFKMLSSPIYASIAAPNQQGRHETEEFSVTLRSNSRGFRDTEWTDLDAAMLGDSYVWGTGVEEAQRFSNLFAQKSGIRVGNFGLSTAGTVNELAIYRDFVRQLSPRYVFLIFYPNDIQNNAWLIDANWTGKLDDPATPLAIIESRRALPPSWPDESNLAMKNPADSALGFFLKTSMEKLKTDLDSKMVATVTGHDGRPAEIEKDMLDADSNWAPALKTYTEAITNAWKLTTASLLALEQAVREDGGKLILVYLPYQEAISLRDWHFRKQAFRLVVPDTEMDFDKPRRVVENFAIRHGVPFHDLTPALVSAARDHPGEALYYRRDGHLTVFGNRVVATSLTEYVNKSLRP